MGEATLSLMSSTIRYEKRRFHPLKPNIMRCACVGDSGPDHHFPPAFSASLFMIGRLYCGADGRVVDLYVWGGSLGVGKTSLLATWREGRFPAAPALSTVYDWTYLNYCLTAKSLVAVQPLPKIQEETKKKEEEKEEEGRWMRRGRRRRRRRGGERRR